MMTHGLLGDLGRLAERAKKRAASATDWLHCAASIHHDHGPTSLDLGERDVVGICLIRDGAFFLPEFLDHHFSLGVRHFVFVDNGSTDGTQDILRRTKHTTLLESDLPAKHYECLLRREAVRRFGAGHWCLCLDADELFDYPFRGDRGLSPLIGYLERRRFTAVVGQLLDLFPSGSLEEFATAPDHVSRYDRYDLAEIEPHAYQDPELSFAPHLRGNSVGSDRVQVLFGGIRRALFGANTCLTKHPLIKAVPEVLPFAHAHASSGVRCADVTALLKHYKFAGGFKARTQELVRRQAWAHGEDERYLAGLERGPLVLQRPESRQFTSVEALIEAGFIVASDEFTRSMSSDA